MADHLLLPEPRSLSDRRQRGGGGGGGPPRNPRQHGRELREELDEAARAAPRHIVEGVDPRRVFKFSATTRLDDDEWPRRGLQLLGDTEDWVYFVVPASTDLDAFRTELTDYAGGEDEVGGSAPLRTFFGVVDEIQPYGPSDRVGRGIPGDFDGLEFPLLVDVTLWPSAEPDEARRRVDDVRAALRQFDGEEVGVDERPATTVMRARVNRRALESLLDLMVVEKVNTPPVPYLEPSDWLTAQPADLEAQKPLPEIVGVLDDGIAAGHPLLADVVVGTQEFPAGHSWADLGPHGTMVAGLAAYGDFEEPLHSGLPLPQPVRVFGARVLEPVEGNPRDTRFPSELPVHRVIEDAIRTLHVNHGVRVFNLSVAEREAYEGPHVAVWTEVLDRLTRELGILIVVAAGNVPVSLASGELFDGLHALHDYPAYLLDPRSRLAEPAIAANVLTVGSSARSAGAATPSGESQVDSHAVADVNQLSPFSRTGPGVLSSAVKPDLVDYGGNYVWSALSQLEPENPGVSAVSLHFDGSGRLFRCASGTSFAAPRVAHIAAALWARYENASANLIRALVGLAATPSSALLDQFEDLEGLRATGYGRPTLGLAVDSTSNRVVMTFDGEVSVDSVVIHPIPIPEEFATGSADREISVALAFDPPVRRTRREYLAGTMRVDLYRNTALSEIEAIHRRQDPDERVAMIDDRRRVTARLRPSSDRVLGSTLQVRRWRAPAANSLSVDDGDTYYLVVTHSSAPWGGNLKEEYLTQGYAVAVELVDRDRTEVDLYNLVQQRVRMPARVRVRT